MHFTVVGIVDDPFYYKARRLLNEVLVAAVADGTPVEEASVESRAHLEPEFEVYLASAVRSLGGDAYAHAGSPFIVLVRYSASAQTEGGGVARFVRPGRTHAPAFLTPV